MTALSTPPNRIAFVCVRNAGRSQMATAFAERERTVRGDDGIELLTGGTDPAERVHPEVVVAMREVGIDLSNRTPRAITTDELRSCDVVITMGCSTLDIAVEDIDVRDWALPDPADQPIERVRSVRDEISARVNSLFDAFSERSDRTVALRLRRVGRNELGSVEELLSVNDLPTEDLQAVELFVASDGSERIGVGGLERRGSNALLRSVAVKEAVRGQGYGTTLTRQLLQHARDSGIETVYLLTTTAADFFITLGFQETERERVPAPIRTTREFVDLCPDSAVCLRKHLK